VVVADARAREGARSRDGGAARVKVAVAVMARAPSAPGKTRLAAYLTPRRLSRLRSAFLDDAIALLASTPDIDPFIFYTPHDAGAEIAAIAGPRVQALAQQGDGLGARMRSAMEELLDRRGVDAAILIGSDMPLLTPQHLADASDLLMLDTIVLGPADDGGYYLIGMRRMRGELFADVEWGTASVLTDTLRIADRLGVEARMIRSGYDVDTIEDLRRLEADLSAAAPEIAPHVRRWFSERS
jgi:rSAM/selenodomain-associated transferase 1